MSQALDQAISRSKGFVSSMSSLAERALAGGGDLVSPDIGMSAFGDNRQQARNRERYSLFRGWLYSAIDARASEAAGQPVVVARMTGAEPNPSADDRGAPLRMKAHTRAKMSKTVQAKSADIELEIIKDHPLVDALEKPNPIQHRWQFVYNFFANLDLTGWSFVIRDEDVDGRPVFFSLPTTWVRPIHSKTEGPFSSFRIINPRDPAAGADKEPLSRDQVAFAYLPNPVDPLSAYAPAAAQTHAIRIDDHIQTSQEAFFDNGIFPSYIMIVGKNPGPTGQQFRPRLSSHQREQVYAAIAKNSGRQNYGRPAIVDGLVEDMKRMSATSNEMGWNKSEDKVRARILSALRVHPYILGEHVSVGGHAQVSAIEKRFCSGVNTGLDMLSTVMTNFLGPLVSQDERTIISWEKCVAVDDQLEQQGMLALRTNNDISQNEIRAFFGLPPDEDSNQDVLGKNTPQVMQLLIGLGNGSVSRDQGLAFLRALGVPDEMAEEIAGEEREVLPPIPPPAAPSVDEEEETTEEAVEALESAVEALGISPKLIADRVVETAK